MYWCNLILQTVTNRKPGQVGASMYCRSALGDAMVAKPKTKTKSARRWSAEVARTSDALDLQPGIFKSASPRRIAQSLKRSADASKRRKTTPFRSAMSMLNFEINRAGNGLSPTKRRILDRAKVELRKVYGRDEVRTR
jgi:Protein of unknown function (DUF3175)